jgi:hypothetical protein
MNPHKVRAGSWAGAGTTTLATVFGAWIPQFSIPLGSQMWELVEEFGPWELEIG